MTAIANAIRRVVPPRYRPVGYLTSLTRRRTDLIVRSGNVIQELGGERMASSAHFLALYEVTSRPLQEPRRGL